MTRGMTMDDERNAADRETARATRDLADRLRASWPAGVLAEVEGDLEYGQFAEAVLDMVAVRRRDGLAWPPGCKEVVDALVDRMDLHRDVARTLAHVDAGKGRVRA